MTLREETNAEFDKRREEHSMTKDQFLRQLLLQEDVRPESIVNMDAIEEISDLERDLRVLCMKEELSDVEKLKVFELLGFIRKQVKELVRT